MSDQKKPTIADHAWFVSKFLVMFAWDILGLFATIICSVLIGFVMIDLGFHFLSFVGTIVSYFSLLTGRDRVTRALIDWMLMHDAHVYGAQCVKNLEEYRRLPR